MYPESGPRPKPETNPEKETPPEKLYRTFTVDPETLTMERLREPLVQGRKNEQDPTKSFDGNEAGVYMSTNQHMTETAYAKGAATHPIATPKYHDGYMPMDFIALPGCGIVVEVNTDKVTVRRPRISTVLSGVYNNGFEGEEWIADEIPTTAYTVKKLVLTDPGSGRPILQESLTNPNDNELRNAIEAIKSAFGERKADAMEFKKFLESLDEKQRLNSYVVKRGWEKWQSNTKKHS